MIANYKLKSKNTYLPECKKSMSRTPRGTRLMHCAAFQKKFLLTARILTQLGIAQQVGFGNWIKVLLVTRARPDGAPPDLQLGLAGILTNKLNNLWRLVFEAVTNGCLFLVHSLPNATDFSIHLISKCMYISLLQRNKKDRTSLTFKRKVVESYRAGLVSPDEFK